MRKFCFTCLNLLLLNRSNKYIIVLKNIIKPPGPNCPSGLRRQISPLHHVQQDVRTSSYQQPENPLPNRSAEDFFLPEREAVDLQIQISEPPPLVVVFHGHGQKASFRLCPTWERPSSCPDAQITTRVTRIVSPATSQTTSG